MNTSATHRPAPRSTVGYWIVIGLLCFGLMVSLGLSAGLLVALMGQDTSRAIAGKKGVDEHPQLNEVWSYGEGEVKAVRIALFGVIMREGEASLLGGAEDKIEALLQEIRAAGHDPAVQAIILEVDSPGGGVTASDEIYAALMGFKAADEKRRVLVFVRDLAASGGYYAAAAGDWLMAEPTSIIGSIGVIMQSLNMKGLSEKIGVRDVTIKSGANKDMLNPFQDTPPEQLAMLQGVIDATYQRFFSLVQASRGMEEAKLKELADGRIFSADQALENGLIDEIGYWDDAVAKTAELVGAETVKVVRYERHENFISWLYKVRLNLKPLSFFSHDRPSLQYLWSP